MTASAEHVATVRSGNKQPLIAVAAFLAFYLAAWATGMRFSARYVDEGWQMLPRGALVDEPLRSVWFMHIQPPLWNLTIGLLLRWSPIPDGLTLQLLMLVLAMILVFLLADITWRLTANTALTVGLPLVAVLHPDILFNVLEPRYELPVACGIAAISWACVRWFSSPRRLMVVAAGAATLVVLTRALYHPGWLVVLVVMLLWVFRGDGVRRQMVIVAPMIAVPILVMLKNLVLFGTFSLSSWTGMNLLRSIEPIVDDRRVLDLWESGKISGVGFVGAFDDLAEYEPFVDPCTPEHSHPVLNIRMRPTQPVEIANFNHECYLPIYDLATSDALRLIVDQPGAWMQGRLESAQAFATRSGELESNPSPLVRLADQAFEIVDVQLPGHLTVHLLSEVNDPIRAPTSYSTIATLSVVVVGVSSAMLLGRRWRIRLANRKLALAVLVGGFSVVWTFVTGVAAELGEQARFRTMVQPLTVTLAGCLVFVVLATRQTGRPPDP